MTEIVNRPNIPAAPEWIRILADGVPPDSSTQQVICNGQNSRGFTVQWAASAGTTSYNLRESNSVQPDATTTSYGGNVTSVALTRSRIAPVTSTTYSYQVQACNGALCSGWRGLPEICVGNDELFTEVVTTVTYYHTDALGSPAAETNSSGGIVKRSRYEPYGAPTTGVFENGPGYTGHMTDSLSKLSYMQQRYYDPALGRFLSVDPVTANRSSGSNFNRYWYGNNSPYNNVDPDGRQSRDFENEYKVSGARPPAQGNDSLGPAIGAALSIVAAPAIAVGAVELGLAVLANPATANSIAIGVMDAVAGDAVGGTSLAVGTVALGKAAQTIGDYHLPGDVPNSYVLARGGTSDIPAPGTTVSVSFGEDLADAGAHVPYGQLRTTTAQSVRDAGGTIDVVPEMTRGGNINGQHANIVEKGETSFGPMQPNPVPKEDRIK